MKTKRILSTFLAAVMMITMLAACGAADATKEFFALNDALSDIRSGTFHEEVTVTVPKELSNNAILNAIGLPMDNLDKDITIDAELDMSINCKTKEAEISFEGAYNGKKPMKVTTVYLKDETAYVNVVELIDFIQNGLEMGDALGIPSEGWKEQLDEQLEGMDYVLIPIETSMTGATKDIDLWDLVEGEGGSELVSLLNDALKASAKDNKLVAVTEESEAKYYTFSISNETLTPAAASMLDYLREHEDDFFDAVNAFMKDIGTDEIPDDQRPSDDDWDELKESVNDIDAPDFSFSYGLRYDKKDKEYFHIFELDTPYKRAPIIRCSSCGLKSYETSSSEYIREVGALVEDWEDNFDCDESGISEIIAVLEGLKDQCQESYDNIPEQLQEGSTGELLQNRIDNLGDVISELEGISYEECRDDAGSELAGDFPEEYDPDDERCEEFDDEEQWKAAYEERMDEETERAFSDKISDALSQLEY